MPRKKRTHQADPETTTPDPLSAPFHAGRPPEPGTLLEPFHAGLCEACASYHRARYIPGRDDLEKALAGERICMGICRKKQKLLVAATREGCDGFVQATSSTPPRVQRDGGGEWVVR